MSQDIKIESGGSDPFNYDEVARLEDLQPVKDESGKPIFEVWFSGVNIDGRKAAELHSSGILERLADGIYINVKNPAGAPEMTATRRRDLILTHGLRIARTIYKDAPLMGASAYHLSHVEGVLCLASFYNSKYGPRNVGGVLTIYHSHIECGLPIGVSTEQLEHEDTLGTIKVEALPDELLILQYFTPYRRRPVPQTQISLGDLSSLIERGVMKRGSREGLSERLGEIAVAMDYDVQLKLALEAINRTFIYTQKKRNQYEYFVYWNKVRTGTLAFDGVAWRFDYDQAFKLKLTLNNKQRLGTVPSFIGSVLPEAETLEDLFEDGFKEFRLADRYLSNITIRKTTDGTAHNTILIDKLEGDLAHNTGEFYEFKGVFSNELKRILEQQRNDPTLIHSAVEDPRSPRMSGVQVKLAGHLSRSGVLSLVSEHKDSFVGFTHIIKPPPAGDKCTVGSMEWFGMTLAKKCGVKTEDFAIADIGGYGPTFIAERFDIPRNGAEEELYLLEDFWSVFGLRVPKLKYVGDVNEVGRMLLNCSSNKDKDAVALFKQVAFSWLIANSDLHLKNMMILKKASSDLTRFESIELSPAYDMLCTQVYPHPSSAALKMGSVNFYTTSSFLDFGKTLKLGQREVENTLKEMMLVLVKSAQEIIEGGKLPEVILNHEPSMEHLAVAYQHLKRRCRDLLTELLSNNRNVMDAKIENREFGVESTQMSNASKFNPKS